MEDRASKYPGRVRLTPVPGQADLFDMVMADEPSALGTPLSKGTLLTDRTCEQLGIPNTSTPDDALRALFTMPNLHLWKRTEIIRKERYSVGPVLQSEIAFITSPGSDIPITFDTNPPPLQVAEDGYPKFSSIAVLRYNFVEKEDIANKFVRLSPTEEHPIYSGLTPQTVYFFPPDVTIRKDDYGGHFDVYASKYQKVTTFPRITKSTLVWSFDPHKYDGQDTETVTYEYLGLWGDKATTIEGKYTGTGEHGSAHPNSITFPATPKFVMIVDGKLGLSTDLSILWIKGFINRYKGGIELVGNTLRYWSNTPQRQLNDVGRTYNYFAIL